MTILYLLIPVTFGMGLVGLGAFMWSLRSGQYEDLAGAAERILFDDTAAPAERASAQPRRATHD